MSGFKVGDFVTESNGYTIKGAIGIIESEDEDGFWVKFKPEEVIKKSITRFPIVWAQKGALKLVKREKSKTKTKQIILKPGEENAWF